MKHVLTASGGKADQAYMRRGEVTAPCPWLCSPTTLCIPSSMHPNFYSPKVQWSPTALYPFQLYIPPQLPACH